MGRTVERPQNAVYPNMRRQPHLHVKIAALEFDEGSIQLVNFEFLLRAKKTFIDFGG